MYNQGSINFSSQDYQKLNNSNITHDRNSSVQNTAMNMSSFTQNEISTAQSVINQARKPTADSTAYTLYKNNNKNARAKLSSNGSIDGDSH